jgi:hypothetical protein
VVVVVAVVVVVVVDTVGVSSSSSLSSLSSLLLSESDEGGVVLWNVIYKVTLELILSTRMVLPESVSFAFPTALTV